KVNGVLGRTVKVSINDLCNAGEQTSEVVLRHAPRLEKLPEAFGIRVTQTHTNEVRRLRLPVVECVASIDGYELPEMVGESADLGMIQASTVAVALETMEGHRQQPANGQLT